MFATYRRFRRHVAVLAALAMLASVLVAVPAVAADPEPDFEATFDACGDAPDAGFTDVPSAHGNAGDINCIAYYTITKGTSATTYSPRASVTREQMALFLTRLAGLVGISMAHDPADPGFMDTGDLSEESQAAVAQLADLGITQGTSSTTYSPADAVTRGQMALFVSRLMNNMTPMADGVIGSSSTTQYGHTPSDVDDNDDDADIGSPFTDLGRATKDAYDAITNLYELGVATGISDTSYSPDASITRAAMAGFIAAVLGHSNARPAGLSIQATPDEGWGDLSATVMVSVRDDSFGPVENQPVDVFSTTSANNGLRKDGTCNFGTNADDVNFGDLIDGDCVFNDNDDATDVDGNLILDQDVDQGSTRLITAWIGEDDDDEFDADDADEVTTSVTAKKEQVSLDVTSTINEHADDDYADEQGQKVDLRSVSEVTFTGQLKDDDDEDVARAGIAVRVEYLQGAEGEEGEIREVRDYVNTHEAELETDENGQVSFTVTGPDDNRRVDGQTRADDIRFFADDLAEETDDILWVEETPMLTSTSVTSPVYVIAGTSTAVRSTVYLYDQYGDSHQSNRAQKTVLTIGDDAEADNSSIRQVISRGYASWRHSLATVAGAQVPINYDVRMLARNSDGVAVQDYEATDTDLDDNDTAYNDGRVITADDTPGTAVYGDDDSVLSRPGADQGYENILSPDTTDLFNTRETADGSATGVDDDGDDTVEVVTRAVSTDVDDENGVLTIITDGGLEGEFLVESGGETTDVADLVYSYDSDDIFIDSSGDEGIEITMDSFAAKIKAGGRTIEVLAYDIDGTSIFRLTS